MITDRRWVVVFSGWLCSTMDCTRENQVNDEDTTDNLFFIEASGSSDSEEGRSSHQRHHRRYKQVPQLARESSPPLLLAFSSAYGRNRQDTSLTSTAADLQEEQAEDSDQPIEEWMILGEEEQVEDSNIQLNLSYGNSSEEDSGDKDMTVENVKSANVSWVVSEKDKFGADHTLFSRYFVPGRSLSCHICNRTGHIAKSCYLHQKSPTCILCGIQGHIQRDCPGRPCQSCGLPSHGMKRCEVAPVWNQHCQRCGMPGHLSDGCPDTWRQYHLTCRLEVPIKPQTACNLKHQRLFAHCYNCSKRGHYGYECSRRRMVSGTFPLLPYVCHYDTMEDILQRHTRMQKRAKGENGEEIESVQGKSRTNEEMCCRTGGRKTWPEKRRQRREVKRLRREAQAMREGGLLTMSLRTSDDEACPFSNPQHQQSTPSQKKRRERTCDVKTRKSREAERWKKRGGIKRGDLHPHGDVDMGSENLLSPKQRVRHRRR